MGAGGQQNETGTAGADNVIRFPRNWFGSVDELVPIGTPAAEHPAPEPDSAAVVCADDFWGEGAGALHQAVQPTAEVPAPGPVPVLATTRPEPFSAVHQPDRTGRPSAGVWWFGAMLAALVLAFVVFGGMSSSAPTRASSRVAPASQSAALAGRREVAALTLSAVRGGRWAGVSEAHSGRSGGAARGSGRNGKRQIVRSRSVRRHPRPADRAGQGGSTTSAGPVGPENGSVPSSGGQAAGSGAGQPMSSAEGATSPSPGAGTDTPSGSTEAPASSVTASAPAGPLTAGTAGSNCDPQCH